MIIISNIDLECLPGKPACVMVGHAEQGLHKICSILYIVYVLYALFNRQTSTKHPADQFYSGISLSANSNVVAGTTLRPRHGSTRRHYNLQEGIFLASSRLCKQTGFALWLLYLSGDLELNPGPVNAKLQRNLKITHLNARSIKNREHYILAKELVSENKFDIFTISESWLDNTVTDIEVEIPGYNIFRLDRLNKAGGGVCVCVSDRFKIECLDDLTSISPSGHQLWLKIQVRNCKSFIICTVYRPPTTSLNCFDEDLSGTVISALSLNKDIYILGDLN